MESYHFRRMDRMLMDRADLLAIIERQRIMTLALAMGDCPYLVTMDYAFDAAEECFYFHSATHGKKMDFLAANPVVWGQVLEDEGYVPGTCDHAYHTVQFRGQVEFIDDMEEKRRALEMMIERFEPDPAALKERLLKTQRLAAVAVGRVRVLEMSGKRGYAGAVS